MTKTYSPQLPLIVSPQWLHKNLHDSELVILDASPKHNKAGKTSNVDTLYIKGSRVFNLKVFSSYESNLPSMLASPEVFQKECRKLGINNTSKIIVYDNLGNYTSPRVWWMFRVMGHNNISVLDGGLPAWVKYGFDTALFPDKINSNGNFTTNYTPELVVGTAQVIDNLSTKDALLIDARTEGRFKGITPEPREGLRSGHIPHSINIPFEQVLNDGFFKAPEKLQQVFGQSIQGCTPLIFSCGSGVTACIVLMACELICKNDKAVYDGSWTAWALMDDLPIQTA
ncbi:sulfurtransferase [Fulvivirga sp. 29W222]|uniref:Sulfurtransferase n=1 Tax=Fulvivirga marina TaxID=2494733 RepID=A0A937KG77_9BACT|nr:sulfurtransferase [Fulvivirga marina]MBL6449105.1 sulfurtransferase [Fulvivirga marina]